MLTRVLIWTTAAMSLAITSSAFAQEVYNQWDRRQALARDVSYSLPATYNSTPNGTSLVLEVKEAVNTFNGIRLRHQSYNGQLVGPVIRIRRGTSLRVRLENYLPPEPTVPTHNGNIPHGFNTTNLHTHGLHVSPESPSDNVFLEVKPGSHYDFRFDIAADHPAGTFWYHAHKHGSTAFQLANGMAGALIVEGGLDNVPEIKAAEEKIMMLQQFVYRDVPGEPSVVLPDDVYQMLVAPQTAVNGQVTPTIVMRPGEVQRWRIIHGGIGDSINLKLDGIPLHEIAVDGLALGTRVERQNVELHPGYRSDVLVKAPLEEKTYLMTTEIQDVRRSLRKRAIQASNVLKVVVAGPPNDMPLPTSQSLARYAPYTDADVPTEEQLSSPRTLRFQATGKQFLINDEPFNGEHIKQVIELNTAEEWSIVGAMGGHPFHVHVNPFAVRVPAGDPNPNRWIWKDTLFVQDQQTIPIRSRFRSHTGKTVLHCHILDHEDQGMMQAIHIVSPGGAARRPVNPNTVEEWTLSSSNGSHFSSRELIGKMTLLVFHKGFACEHCALQIKALTERSQEFSRAAIRIVAISPELPAAPDLESLRRRWNLDFPVLADPDKKVFRQFDCVDTNGDALHGTFLISPKGKIALRIIDPQPTFDFDRFLKRAKIFLEP